MECKWAGQRYNKQARGGIMIENIGRKIKTFRKPWRLTIQEMAEQSGVSSSLLSQMERGIGNPTISVLEAVSHVMDCVVADLSRDVKNSDLVVRHRERKRIYEGEKRPPCMSLIRQGCVST